MTAARKPAPASGPAPVSSFADLAEARYILLTTFRRDGTPMPTPVCNAVADGIVYTSTAREAGKVKRIRNNPHVTIAACDIRGRTTGPTYAGTARILTGADADRATRLKEARNRLAKLRRIMETRLRGRAFVGIAIRPGPVAGPDPSA